MNEFQKMTKTIKWSEILWLKRGLLVLTSLYFIYFAMIFYEPQPTSFLGNRMFPIWSFTGLNYSFSAVVLWYNWKRFPLERKKKLENTWMILLLGIIGLWLWMPTKKEVESMNISLKDSE